MWTSMFDMGVCHVQLSHEGLLWSGPLAKGETSPSVSSSLPQGGTANFSVGVDSAGVVTLSSDTESDGVGFQDWIVGVYPQYDVSASYTRAIDITAFSGSSTGDASSGAPGNG